MFVHCSRMCETVDVPYRCEIIQNLTTKIAWIQVIPITLLLSYTYSITENHITRQIPLKQDTQISKHQYDQTQKGEWHGILKGVNIANILLQSTPIIYTITS
jgi:hypothetical protein